MGLISSIKNNKLKSVLFVVSALILFFLLFMYSNKVAPISWDLYGAVNTDDGVALQGSDVVAYHTVNKFIPGNSKYSYKTNDAIWYFSSAINKKLFIEAPEKYTPQYGGYCAFAITLGVTANAMPEHWTIQDGKLYIFNDSDVKSTWINDLINGSMATADENWATRL